MNIQLGIIFSALFLVNSVHSLIGGNPATAGQFPAQVAVHIHEAAQTLCGGTIVNRNHIVTAASCVFNERHEVRPPTQIFFTPGQTGLTPDAPRHVIIAVFPHPTYNPYTFQNNIAVLRTANELAFNPNISTPLIEEARMNERIVADGTICQIIGWNVPGGAISTALNVLPVTILNRDTVCNTGVNHNGRLTEAMICAGTVPPTQGSICPSTRGGGLYCNNVFTGIASAGVGCGQDNIPGSYIQVRMFTNWIIEQFTRIQIPPPGTTVPPGIPSPPPGGNSGSRIIVSTFLIMLSMLIARINF